MAERAFTDAEVARVAAGLTKAQRNAVLEAGLSPDGDKAPFCGCYRRAGSVMGRLSRGPDALFRKVPKSRAKVWHYAFLPLGLAVRAFILEKGNV